MPFELIAILSILGLGGLGFGFGKLSWDGILLPLKRAQFRKLIQNPKKQKKLIRKFYRNSGHKAGIQIGATFSLPALGGLLATILQPEAIGVIAISWVIFMVGAILTMNIKIGKKGSAAMHLGRPKGLMDRMEQIAMGALVADNSATSRKIIKDALRKANDPIAVNTVLALVDSNASASAPLLEAALRHPDANVVLFAAFGLLNIDMERFQKNVHLLIENKNPEVRRLVMDQLEQLPPTSQRILLNAAKRDPQKDIRTEALHQEQRLKSTEELEILEKWMRDPEKVEWKGALQRLHEEFHDGSWHSVRAARIALGNPIRWENIVPLLEDLQRNPGQRTLEPVVRQLGRMKTALSRSALLWLLGEPAEEIRENALEKLRFDPELDLQDLLKPLSSQNPEVRKGALMLVAQLDDAPLLHLVRKFAGPDEHRDVRLAGIRLLQGVEPGKEQLELLKKALLDGGDYARVANEVVRKQADMRALNMLQELYGQSWENTNSHPDNSMKIASFAYQAPFRNMIIRAGESIINAQPVFQGKLEELLCMECLSRAQTLSFGPWTLAICRTCENYGNLAPGVKTLVGVIREGYEPVGQPAENILEVDIWNEDLQAVRPADLDHLRIEGGGELNYDWAVNAVLEQHRNHALNPKKLKIHLVNHPRFSENTKRMLREFRTV